jgi:3D (Asp-Asp-Asp) domain-containing protein
MFTKSVVVCALSGALVSATLPNNPVAGEAHAQERKASKHAGEHEPLPPEDALATATHRSSRSPTRSRTQRPLRVQEQKARQRLTVNQEKPNDLVDAQLGTFSVTAYTHYRNRHGGVNKTASGTVPAAGRTVAVDPRVIPLGSRIYIAGIGERIAEDTGGKIKGKKLDLFLSSVPDCLRFGVRQHEVLLIVKD